mgnify:FL=1
MLAVFHNLRSPLTGSFTQAPSALQSVPSGEMLFIASLILAASAVSASVSSLGSTVEVGGIPYYVPAGAKVHYHD